MSNKRKKTKNKRKKYKTKNYKRNKQINNLSNSLKNSQSMKKEYKIIDVPFSGKINRGTAASHGEIDYHYQNYTHL